MSDEQQKRPDADSEHFHAIWEYGLNPSSRQASKEDMSAARKAMIRFALEHPVRDIRTYSGYKGDLLIQITTTARDLLPLLKAHAESLEMQTVIKERNDIGIHEIYCITPDEDVYGIKPEVF